MHHNCPPRLQGLYLRAQICRMFPAYKLHELRDTPAGELLQAVQLLGLAEKVKD